jgi:hypothetical protein
MPRVENGLISEEAQRELWDLFTRGKNTAPAPVPRVDVEAQFKAVERRYTIAGGKVLVIDRRRLVSR